ncbi:hypothetical protein GJAV_G00061530, partial [Gymnothorax javanicus]
LQLQLPYPFLPLLCLGKHRFPPYRAPPPPGSSMVAPPIRPSDHTLLEQISQIQQTHKNKESRGQLTCSLTPTLKQPEMERQKPAMLVLLAAFAMAVLAAEESCLGRCESGFDAKMRCQCDSMCRYYKSCCSDYDSICGSKTRGDTFAFAEDDDDLFNSTTPAVTQTESDGDATSQQLSPTATASSTVLRVTSPVSIALSTATPPIPTLAPRKAPNPARDPAKVPKPVADPTKAPNPAADPTPASTTAPDPAAEPCSGMPFDAFMQLKNGSIFAFRGDYFFELDEKAVLPGYPKLIKDVWGIPGPIDAAFTRINCQGKTYIFKGNKYWRFEDGMLDDDYPRDISVGFEKIPDDVNAAFAIPASNHLGKEKVYFFKGDQYYQYEFKHQPTHEECSRMNRVSPSIPFTCYADLYYDRWENIFSLMFQGSEHGGPRFINRDWVGIHSPVDAAMVGRLYITPRPLLPRQDGRGFGVPWGRGGSQGWGRQQRRQNRSPQWSSMADWGSSLGQDYAEQFYNRESRRQDQEQETNRYGNQKQNWNQQESTYGRQQQQYDQNYNLRYSPPRWPDLHIVNKGQPVQSVYFFKKDQYYRVNLQTKVVDFGNPPYPRSIAKYWLGCPDNPRAEKR